MHTQITFTPCRAASEHVCEETVKSMQDKFVELHQKVNTCPDHVVSICNMMQILIVSKLRMTACLHCWVNDTPT